MFEWVLNTPVIYSKLTNGTQDSSIDTRADNVSHPVLKTILKYGNHPSIDAIRNVKARENFEFLKVCCEDVVKDLQKVLQKFVWVNL